jgi:putative membrane protein
VVRTALVASAILVASSQRILAHGAAPEDIDRLWAHWSTDPLVAIPVLACTLLYLRGLAACYRRLGRRPAALPPLAPAQFLLGQIVVVLALLSPLDAASGELLSAHMIQHVLLVAVAPPLLLAGRPEALCLHGLPEPWRRSIARARPVRAGLLGVRVLAQPLPATVAHGAALWVWHAPALFEAARGSALLHAAEHACFFGTALLFWRGIVGASRRPAALAGAAAALITLVHSGFLSALIGLSPRVLFLVSTQGAAAWGLTPLEDQHLAGAIMWVPTGAIYLVAGLAMAARAIAPKRPTEPVVPGPVGEAERTLAAGS